VPKDRRVRHLGLLYTWEERFQRGAYALHQVDMFVNKAEEKWERADRRSNPSEG